VACVRSSAARSSRTKVSRSPSVGAIPLEDGRDRVEQDVAIEPQRAVVEVEFVETLLQIQVGVAAFRDLPEARKSGPDRCPPAPEVGVHGSKVVVWKWPRPHDAHLARDYVEKLRHLVEAGRSKKLSDERQDTGILAQLEVRL